MVWATVTWAGGPGWYGGAPSVLEAYIELEVSQLCSFPPLCSSVASVVKKGSRGFDRRDGLFRDHNAAYGARTAPCWPGVRGGHRRGEPALPARRPDSPATRPGSVAHSPFKNFATVGPSRVRRSNQSHCQTS